jgi:hypothetical protein
MRGRTVSDQVDPQNLGRQQWQDDRAASRVQSDPLRQHHPEEHRQHFADV